MKLNSREFKSATLLGGSVNSIRISHYSISYSLLTQERSFDLDPSGVLDLIKYLVFDCMDSSERKAFLSLLPDLPAANNSTRETWSIHNHKHSLEFFEPEQEWHKGFKTIHRQTYQIWEFLSKMGIDPESVLQPDVLAVCAEIMMMFMNHKETAEPQAKAAHAYDSVADLTPSSSTAP